MNSERKLFLLDAYALIYRSYFAFIKNPRINSKGLNTSAIYGFTTTLEGILQQEKPSHIAVVFDPKGGSFRQEIYPEYKANREETPEDIRISIPIIKEIIESFRIPVVEVPNYEADDVIGTLSKQAAAEGFEVYMMTPDKDFGQLVDERIFIYKPGRGGNEFEIMGIPEVKQKFQIEHPLQVIDILALWGDASDNIPGAPGIGEKTAQKLIQAYGSVEHLLENLHELKGKQKESLEQNREQVLLSKRLATIALDAPVQFDEHAYRTEPVDVPRMKKLFDELEFRTLSARLLSQPVSQPQVFVQGSLFDEPTFSAEQMNFETLSGVAHTYRLVNTVEEMRDLAHRLQAGKSFAFCTAATHSDPNLAQLAGLAFSYRPHESFFVPVPPQAAQAESVLQHFRAAFANPAVEKIAGQLKNHILLLKWYNAEVSGPLFDPQLAHYLLHPDLKHNSDFLAQIQLNYQMQAPDSVLGGLKSGRNLFELIAENPSAFVDFFAEDADIHFQLKEKLSKELQQNYLLELAREIEFPLIPVLAEMEKTGVRLETESLSLFAKDLTKWIGESEKEIIQMAGVEFNVASPKQLGEVLFEHLKLDDKAKKTKSGQYATNEETLMQLADKHPIILKILDYRGYRKLLSTYVEALPLLINPKSGNIHTSYNQTVAATGRLSSVNPNLQNIPIREEQGREIRRSFTASSPEHVFFSADYSQIELRLMAHLSQDVNLLEAFRQDEDIHTATAAKIFKLPLQEVTREMRARAKTANFGIIYGISSFGLSQRLAISRSEGKSLIDGYFESYPGVKAYMDYSIRIARERGYVKTIMGRRRELADINSRNAVVRGVAERNAINAPIQGSAADIIKIAMIRIHKRFLEEGLQSRMILQVHDELNFNVLRTELEQVKAIVLYEMEQAVPLSIPIKVDFGMGENWLEAH